LGFGFLESVYQNALLIELKKAGLQAEKEKRIQVYYDSQLVGDFVADIVVEQQVIIELKSIKELHPAHEAQLTNYLRATGIEVGLLINFSESVEVRRKVFDRSSPHSEGIDSLWHPDTRMPKDTFKKSNP
jgi:GxxExxY protein